MRFKAICFLAFSVLLPSCGNSAPTVDTRDAVYDRSLACYESDKDSEECVSSYKTLIKLERETVNADNIKEYEEKYCKGLTKDNLLCEVAGILKSDIEQEEYEKFQARVEFYLDNRSKLRKKYNKCGRDYYRAAGLKRDGEWIGASGSGKLSQAMKQFGEDFNYECRAAAQAANRLDIDMASYFVKTL